MSVLLGRLAFRTIVTVDTAAVSPVYLMYPTAMGNLDHLLTTVITTVALVLLTLSVVFLVLHTASATARLGPDEEARTPLFVVFLLAGAPITALASIVHSGTLLGWLLIAALGVALLSAPVAALFGAEPSQEEDAAHQPAPHSEAAWERWTSVPGISPTLRAGW